MLVLDSIPVEPFPELGELILVLFAPFLQRQSAPGIKAESTALTGHSPFGSARKQTFLIASVLHRYMVYMYCWTWQAEMEHRLQP